MFGLGRLVHQSNTFAKSPTTLSDFEHGKKVLGDGLLQRFTGTNTAIGGAIDACESHGIPVFPLIAAQDVPSGPVTADSLDYLVELLRSKIAEAGPGLEAIFLDLHGAMVAEGRPAADEYVLQRVRETVDNLPVAVVLDSHANLTPGLVEHADVVLGYDTFPRLDPGARGREAVDILRRIARGDLHVEKSLRRLPILIPVVAQHTGRAPMCQIMEQVRQIESEQGIVAASVFGGFPYADVHHAGASVVVVAERGSSGANDAADRLAHALWERRAEFTVPGMNVEEAIHDAMAAREGPIVIADLGDSPGGGAPCDGTTLLWALLDLGARDAVLAVIADEQAVEACVNAGPGGRVEIPLGGRRDTRHGFPIDVRGKVKTITDGTFMLEGPVDTGLAVDMGRAVVMALEARHGGSINVIVTEKRVQPVDATLLRHAGIQPEDHKIIVLKSSAQFRAAFESIAAQIYEVITPGITTPDPAFFEYRNVQRPIYPLDPM
jgi:microcystin degradation protein MlrC